MQFFVRSTVVSGLLGIGVEIDEVEAAWRRWEAVWAMTPLDDISATKFAQSLYDCAGIE